MKTIHVIAGKRENLSLLAGIISSLPREHLLRVNFIQLAGWLVVVQDDIFRKKGAPSSWVQFKLLFSCLSSLVGQIDYVSSFFRMQRRYSFRSWCSPEAARAKKLTSYAVLHVEYGSFFSCMCCTRTVVGHHVFFMLCGK